MQDKFGKKLEGARTQQGISIREAADATKIRSDFLLSFENNHGDFKIHEVYKRGFIKLYARYLGLDPEDIIKDYDDYHRASRNSKKQPQDSFGRINLSASETESYKNHDTIQTTLPLEPGHTKVSIHTPSDPEATTRTSGKTSDETKALYVKIGLIFGGTLALFTFLAILINSIIQPEPNSIEEELAKGDNPKWAENTEAYLKQMADPKTADAFAETLTLRGDEIVHVVVRQETDKKRLFTGNVDPKKPITISRSGPVKIHFSNGSKLTIEKADGQKVKPGREGIGWIQI